MATSYKQREILAGFDTLALHAGADPVSRMSTI
jgi:hypothetical protein